MCIRDSPKTVREKAVNSAIKLMTLAKTMRENKIETVSAQGPAVPCAAPFPCAPNSKSGFPGPFSDRESDPAGHGLPHQWWPPTRFAFSSASAGRVKNNKNKNFLINVNVS